jgi:hypothetical protein
LSIGRRLRSSAARARQGRRGGLAGPLLARLGYGQEEPKPGPGRPQPEAEAGAGERRDPWDEQAADAYDDRELAALRDELNTELDRLTRPQNDEAPGP